MDDEKAQLIADCDGLAVRVRGGSDAHLARLTTLAQEQDKTGLRAFVEEAAPVGAEVRALDARLHVLMGGVGAVGHGGSA